MKSIFFSQSKKTCPKPPEKKLPKDKNQVLIVLKVDQTMLYLLNLKKKVDFSKPYFLKLGEYDPTSGKVKKLQSNFTQWFKTKEEAIKEAELIQAREVLNKTRLTMLEQEEIKEETEKVDKDKELIEAINQKIKEKLEKEPESLEHSSKQLKDQEYQTSEQQTQIVQQQPFGVPSSSK